MRTRLGKIAPESSSEVATGPAPPKSEVRLLLPREPELVLVDFDDTLVDTAPRFQKARRDLFSLLERVGFTREEIHRVHHEEVDPRMIDRYGLGPFRLEPSFRETYLRLCAEARRAPDPIIADECAALGLAVAGTPPLLDGALEALSKLDAAL